MKVTVCFKPIPDFDMMSGRNPDIIHETIVDTSYIKRIFNCFEESALELALKLSDHQKEKKKHPATTATALTIDQSWADTFLKHLMAVKFDEAVRIEPDHNTDLRFNPHKTSQIIASYIKPSGPQQLVLLGKQGGEGDNRQTGFLLAERLGWPCIRDVSEIKPGNTPDSILVKSRTDGAVMEQTAALPLVLVVGNTSYAPFLRVPTLRQRLDTKNRQIKVLSSSQLLKDNNKEISCCTLLKLQSQEKSKPCNFIKGDSVKQKVEILYSLYLKERLTR